MDNSAWTDSGAFWIALASALVSFVSAMIGYYVLRSSIDPQVIVYATADDERPSIINLVIENVGKGLAKDVTFEFSRPIPAKAFGFENAPQPPQMTSGPLIKGIPALGPGARRVITWGQYGGLYKALGDETIDVRVRFRGDPVGIFGATHHEVLSHLDVLSFEGTDASDRNWAKQTATQIRRLAETLDKAASGFRPLKVEVTQSRVRNGEAEAD